MNLLSNDQLDHFDTLIVKYNKAQLNTKHDIKLSTAEKYQLITERVDDLRDKLRKGEILISDKIGC